MKLNPNEPTGKGDAERFIGDTWIDRIAGMEPNSHLRVNVVRFAPGSRNAWHRHTLGQTLHVTEGVGRVQARGSEPWEIRAGDTIYTEPGEWHWHGAAPDQFMTHLAIWEAPADGSESEFGEHVSDADYRADAHRPDHG